MVFRKKRKLHKTGIDFDEILLDSHNRPSFDTQQFEGRIEQTISKSSLFFIGVFFMLVLVVFSYRLFNLQIRKGGHYLNLSERNSLDGETIFADRGLIYDRNNVELAWNVRSEEMSAYDFAKRDYTEAPGFGVILGYVKYPQKDKYGFYWQKDFQGMSGIEKAYNSSLNGQNGSKIVEVNAVGETFSENVLNEPVSGKNMVLTIDAALQEAMYNSIKTLAEDVGYVGGAGAIMDIHTGELLVATSYPEYNPQILSDGNDREAINNFLNDSRKPFLNRLVGGLYSSGSTVKPFIALGALNEGIINANTTVLSTGKIEIPNPYDSTKSTTFRDWKEGGHGTTDVKKALAESVNTFFYAIGGGYKGQAGLGVSKIEEYVRLFGIGSKTGVDILGEVGGTVPNPDWKKKNFKDGVWRLGDTYNTSIGQYGFQVTPIEMLKAVGAIANSGTLVTPHIVSEDVSTFEKLSKDFREGDFALVRSGMREVISSGTGLALNVPYVDIAAKTGSAQTGLQNKFLNSWVVGFFPYEHPKYAFVTLMDRGPSTAERSAAFGMRSFFDWIHQNKPEYLSAT
jgi:penicillin-binding protein 2